ncbi:hypothetical protein F5148DRAFT_1148903 [Russula earlei]|uniref:Uncharacterized protein n=1 Tax=Russula earlei TaxID=71964 RepID=A0ACC0UAW2_9AGAM|nr:hypothetical protein F5148DRAFT_1148903 [Russula earlei]
MSVDAEAAMEPKKKNSGWHVTRSHGAMAGQSTGSDKTQRNSIDLGTDNDHYSAVESPEQQDKSGDDSNDSIVEVMARKESKPVTATMCKKVAIAQEEGNESFDDENEMFLFTVEVINIAKGNCTIEIIMSTIPWFTLQQKLAQHLNVYPSALHAQYRLSTDPKGSLPLDLTTLEHFDTMIALLQPLVVPPCLQNGKRSTRKMKEVKVVVTNRDDELPSTDSRHQIKKSTKFGSVPSDSNVDRQRSKGKLFHENKVEAQKTILNAFSCDIHSLPDKPTLCWKDLVQHLCYPITESHLNLWATMHVKDPKKYPATTKPAEINVYTGLPPLPNPVLAKTKVPRIGPWLEYCDMHRDCQGEDFSKHVDKFDKEGYHRINQLVRDHMSEEKLLNWVNIGKGTADLLIQYAMEDMELVNTRRFSMVG